MGLAIGPLMGAVVFNTPAQAQAGPEESTAAPIPAESPAPSATVPDISSQTLAVCASGCTYATLGAAFDAAQDGDVISVAPGVYTEGAVLKANAVTVIAASGAHLRGGTVEGKAALVIKGNDTVISGLECSDIAVPHRNGACIRLEGHNLTLRNVHFHDSQQGLLANNGTGTVVIEDSLFEYLGAKGRAHGIYVNDIDELVIRRSVIASSRDQAHEVKSRAARTVIEESILASMDGVDSRTLDVPNGGEVIIRNSVLQAGPNSANYDIIGFGLEGVKHERNSLTLDNVTVISDHPRGQLLRGVAALTLTRTRVIGGRSQPQSADVWIPDRATAGLPPHPALPNTGAAYAPTVTPPTEIRVCLEGGCDYRSLTKALREATTGATIVLTPGTYFEPGVLRASGVTIRAEPGAILKGAAAEKKAALVIKGNDTTVDGLECLDIAVRDRNGACIRLEGVGLILRNVYFHDSQEGLLANDGSGDILIEDSRFERLGEAGQAHAIYVNKASSLTIRRTQILSTRDLGHAVKSRAVRTVIEDSVLATLEGEDSRLIDVANGGSLIVRNCVLEKGPGSDNDEAIGFGLGKLLYPSNHLSIQNTTVIMDRTPNRLVRSVVRGTVSGGRMIGVNRNPVTRLAGTVLDMVAPGYLGNNVSFDQTVQWYPDREAAGLAPFPALPPVPEGDSITTEAHE